MTGGFAIGSRQVASSFTLLAAIAMVASSYSVLAVPLAREFEPTRMVLMLAMTVMAAASGVLAPLLGDLMDRFSLRALMLVGAVLMGAGYLLISIATSFTHVLVTFGVLLAPANVLLGPMAVTVLLSRWFAKRRGAAIGLAIAGISMGGVVFPPMLQFLLDSYEWRVAVRIFAVIVLVLIVPAAALVVNSPAERGLNPDGADTSVEAQDRRPPAGAVNGSAIAILKDPAFWLMGILFSVVTAGMKGMVTNLVPLAVDEGIDATQAAFLISIFSGAGFFAKMGFAGIADRINPRVLALVAFGGFAGGMAALSEASAGYSLIALGVAMIGFFGGLIVPLQSFLVPRVFGSTVVGRAMGLLSTLGLCASLATPPLFGLMFDLTGSYSGISLAFAGLAMASMLAIPAIRMTSPAGEAVASDLAGKTA
ncbi:MAG: MFS transporter [Novosphingobium sp.]|nr:MFS transporter [Novosphingobium sp.]